MDEPSVINPGQVSTNSGNNPEDALPGTPDTPWVSDPVTPGNKPVYTINLPERYGDKPIGSVTVKGTTNVKSITVEIFDKDGNPVPLVDTDGNPIPVRLSHYLID